MNKTQPQRPQKKTYVSQKVTSPSKAQEVKSKNTKQLIQNKVAFNGQIPKSQQLKDPIQSVGSIQEIQHLPLTNQIQGIEIETGSQNQLSDLEPHKNSLQSQEKVIRFVRQYKKPINFELYITQLVNQKDHFLNILMQINIISKDQRMNDVTKITEAVDLKISRVNQIKENFEDLFSNKEQPQQTLINQIHETCIRDLDDLLQEQTNFLASKILGYNKKPESLQKKIQDSFIKIFLDPTSCNYGSVQSQTIQYSKLSRYNVDIDVNNLSELSLGQWLSNSTIDFVCEYFMEKQLLNFNGGRPNLIVPYRIFEGYKDFCDLTYFKLIKIKYKIPDISIFEAFKYIGIPINVNGSHWVSIVIDTQKKIIHVYDSLRQHNSGVKTQQHNVNQLLSVIEKYSPETSTQYEISYDLCAGQQNGFDCGVFVLKFIQAMMNNELDQSKLNFNQESVSKFRKYLYYLIPMICTQSEQLDLSTLSQIESGSFQ